MSDQETPKCPACGAEFSEDVTSGDSSPYCECGWDEMDEEKLA